MTLRGFVTTAMSTFLRGFDIRLPTATTTPLYGRVNLAPATSRACELRIATRRTIFSQRKRHRRLNRYRNDQCEGDGNASIAGHDNSAEVLLNRGGSIPRDGISTISENLPNGTSPNCRERLDCQFNCTLRSELGCEFHGKTKVLPRGMADSRWR